MKMMTEVKRCQFHQHFTSNFCNNIFATIFFHQYFSTKKLQSQNVTREKLCKALLYKKFARKMLMKLTKGGKKTIQQCFENSYSVIWHIGKLNLAIVVCF